MATASGGGSRSSGQSGGGSVGQRRRVTRRAPTPSGFRDDDPYKDLSNYDIGRLPAAPPDHTEFTNKHAYFVGSDGKGGVLSGTRFEFWCMEVSTSFGAEGEKASSRNYDAQYYKSFNQGPYSIKGRVPNEAYYDGLVQYIRASHIAMAKGRPRLRLMIPAANIAVYGYVKSIRAGHTAAGFRIAPEFDIEFVVTLDKRISRPGKLSQEVLAYFLDPKEKYWKKAESAYLDELQDQRNLLSNAARARRRAILNTTLNTQIGARGPSALDVFGIDRQGTIGTHRIS